jgi:Zn-dependent protease with chaperone function
MRKNYLQKSIFALAMIWTMAMMPIAAAAQTRVSMPKNKYKVQDDVKLGRDYSVEIEKQFPVLNDRQANDYVQNVGARLVASIPQQFRQPAFDYNFQVVNASDINAFALPGGPMYVNRGMIQAAKNEGEMAGVMAHEIAHVALRHATAQATKQGSVGSQLGQLGLILGGAILGGQAGAQAGMIAAQAWQTKYSRDYETQADYLGSQIMADAGYDPRDLANMFQTIAREGGGRGPEFLSSHPDPGNRFQKINQEAQRLNVSPNPIKVTREFERIQARMRSLPPARTMAQLQQEYQNTGGRGSGQSAMSGGRYTTNVPLPSTQTRAYSSGNWIRMNVPSNWKEFGSQSQIMFAPEGAYGDEGITHGTMVGLHQGQSGNLSADTRELVNVFLQGNTYLRQQGGIQNARFAGRQGYSTVLSGTSPITRRNETVTVYTARLRNGETFYVATVSPQQNSARYDNAFRTMLNSIRLNDVN